MTRPPAAVTAFAATYRCPDCIAEVGEIWQDDNSIWHITVAHDDTCPSYQAL